MPVFILLVGLLDIIGIPSFFLHGNDELLSLSNGLGNSNDGISIWIILFDWYPDLARIIIHIILAYSWMGSLSLNYIKRYRNKELSTWAKFVMWQNTGFMEGLRLAFWIVFEFFGGFVALS